MFDLFDVDGSKLISLDEFVNNSEWEDMFHMKDNAFSMFHKMDKNGDGYVSFMELMAVTFPLASRQQLKVGSVGFIRVVTVLIFATRQCARWCHESQAFSATPVIRVV